MVIRLQRGRFPADDASGSRYEPYAPVTAPAFLHAPSARLPASACGIREAQVSHGMATCAQARNVGS